MTVKKFSTAVIIIIAAAICFAQRPGSTTTITLEDGNDAILHPDSTWAYVKTVLNDPQDDMFITLRDNRILWLKKDYTYTFTKTMPKSAANTGNRNRNYQAVSVTGVSTNRDLNTAFVTAQNDAYTKAATAMHRFAPNTKAARDFVMACLRDDFKEHLIDQSQNQTAQGWKVEAKIALPAHRVQKIIECVDLQLEQ